MSKKKNFIPLATSGINQNAKLMTTKEQLQMRKKLAKRINQRMLRLERKGLTNGGAYADYQDILNKFFDGASRIPENEKIFKHLPRTELQALQKLLKEKTSTVQGWNEVMQKRVHTIKERYGVEFNNNYDLYDFLKSLEFKEMSKLYSSKQALSLIGKSNYSPEEFKKLFNEISDKTNEHKADAIAKKLGFKNEADALRFTRKGE